MTDEELTAIEERVQHTTPGPWVPYEGSYRDKQDWRHRLIVGVEGPDGDGIADVAGGRYPGEEEPDHPPEDLYRQSIEVRQAYHDAHAVWLFRMETSESVRNAIFIAHAREDVPALLAEVRRVRATLAEIEQLRADLVHARHWANLQRALPAASIETEGTRAAAHQSAEYCVPARLPASDGWQVGQKVPSANAI